MDQEENQWKDAVPRTFVKLLRNRGVLFAQKRMEIAYIETPKPNMMIENRAVGAVD